MDKSKHPDRIGFEECSCEHLPGNRFTARVVLAWPGGNEFVGTSQAEDTEIGRLWCAAEATARALEQSVNRDVALTIDQVQRIPHPGIASVVTLLSSRGAGGEQEFAGLCIMGEQPERSAALAVLKATNRLVFNITQSN